MCQVLSVGLPWFAYSQIRRRRATILARLTAILIVIANSNASVRSAAPADKPAPPAAKNQSGQNQSSGSSGTSAETAVDSYGDPLPAGALLRLGTVRLRHASAVLSVAFSPNGQTLASVAMLDPRIQLWDVRRGRLTRTLVGSLTDQPRRAVFSPNGARLASVGSRGGVHLWDVATGLELRETPESRGQPRPVTIAFAPDGRHFVAAGDPGAIDLWDADSSGRHRLLVDLGKLAQGNHALAYSPDGKLLACSVEGSIRLLNAETGTTVGEIGKAHAYEICGVAFGVDGKTLISAGDSEYRPIPGTPNGVDCDARLRIWDVATHKLARELNFTPPEKGQCAAAISGDRRTLASRQANSLMVWDVETGRVKQKIPSFWLSAPARDTPIEGHWGFNGDSLAISADATRLAAVNSPLHTLTIWDAATGRPVPDFTDSHGESITGLACSPDGSHIATAGGRDGTVRLWDSATGKTLRTFVIGDNFPCEVRSVAFAPDGKSIVAGGPRSKDRQTTGIVRIWDVASGAVRLELRPGVEVSAVAISQDGSQMAVATSNFREFFMDDDQGKHPPRERTLLIVDAKTGAERQRIKLGGFVNALGFSGSGASVSVVAEGGKVSTWDAATGKLQHASPVAPNPRRQRAFTLCAAALAADGSLAVVNMWSTSTATIWDCAQGTKVGDIELPSEGTVGTALAISPDKRLLASSAVGVDDRATEKHSIRLWDLHTGRLLKQFTRPIANRVKTMIFTPDGKRLITGMSDGTCLVWDVSGL